MKNVIKAAACVALLAAASAHADTFDFSYTFDDGSLVTGSLDGSLVGDTVQNVSDIHASYKGIAFTGTLSAAGLNSDATLFDQPAVVSTDASKNNFAFTDAVDTAALNAGSFLTFFEMTAAGVTAGNANLTENNASFDLGPNGSWSLKPVPLPAGFLLFSSGLGLCGALRRRFSARSA
jgi:hypothetical protein